MDVNLSQPLKALLSTLRIPEPRVKDFRLLQPPNAEYPMTVTELGMVTLVRPLQSRNILNIDNQ